MRRRVLIVAIILASAPTLALAADNPTASALVLQGGDLFKRENYEGARAAFARAYEIDPKAATLFDLALSELNADRPVEAAAHLRAYLTRADEPAVKLEAVRSKWLPRAEARTARVDVFAPAGSQFAVDGAVPQDAKTATGPTGGPTTLIVAAGEHDVSARQGALSETQHVTARGGELVELHFQRVAAAPAPAVAIGWTGSGETQGRAEGGASHAKWITVVALGSAAVVAAGFGVGFGIAAANKASDAQNVQNVLGSGNSQCHGASAPPSCAQLASDVESNRLNWGISAASYVGAGVLGAASLATWMLWKPKSGAIAARPLLDAQTGGVVVDGRW